MNRQVSLKDKKSLLKKISKYATVCLYWYQYDSNYFEIFLFSCSESVRFKKTKYRDKFNLAYLEHCLHIDILDKGFLSRKQFNFTNHSLFKLTIDIYYTHDIS